MRSNKLLKSVAMISILFPALFALVGFAVPQTGVTAGQGAAVTLAYQFPDGRTLVYQDTNTETQNLEIMGQTVSTQHTSSIDFSLKPKGLKEGNFIFGVTIDAFKVDTESPQGNLSADTGSIVGKSFDMTLSRSGKEIDTTGALPLEYELGPSGKRSIGPGFQAFFPDLPDRPVKVGDTWPSEDTVTDKSESGLTRIVSKNENTVDGFETVDGFDCIRIKTTSNGTMTGSMQQNDVELSFDVKLNGSATWYFAVKEGIYVKADSKAGISGTITAGEPVNSTIPLSGESRGETRLVKK